MPAAIYPKYSQFYPGVLPTITELLKSIPSIHTVSFSCFINAIKHREPHDLKLDMGLFTRLHKNQPKGIIVKNTFIMSTFIEQNKKNDAGTVIFPIRTILNILQHEIENWKNGDFKQLSPQDEENIWKAILVYNENEEKEYIEGTKGKGIDNSVDTFAKTFWPLLLPTMDLQFAKEIILPLNYSTIFFKHLEENAKLSEFLKKYLAVNNCASWQEYLKKLTMFYINGVNKEDDWFFFRIDAKYIESMAFMENYICDISKFDIDQYKKETLNENFKLFREKPILKLANGYYVIMYWNFFIDKLFSSQKFDFYNYSGIKETYKGDDEDKKWQTYNGELGNFSEKKIFLRLAERFFHPTANSYLEEDKKDKTKNQDLYYRYGNEICFIEYKAVFLPHATKYEEIKNNVEHPDKLLKAVKQLIYHIIELSKNINKFEDLTKEGFESKHLIIYPLVVYADQNWSLYGVREYLDRILKQELDKQTLGFFKVEDLVLIHNDVLHDYEKLFLENKLPLPVVLKEHNKKRKELLDLHEKNPSVNSALTAFADASVFIPRAFPGRFTYPLDSTYFKELMVELKA